MESRTPAPATLTATTCPLCGAYVAAEVKVNWSIGGVEVVPPGLFKFRMDCGPVKHPVYRNDHDGTKTGPAFVCLSCDALLGPDKVREALITGDHETARRIQERGK